MLFFNLGNLFADCRLGEVQSVSSLREVLPQPKQELRAGDVFERWGTQPKPGPMCDGFLRNS
jgi:hypothetical protein